MKLPLLAVTIVLLGGCSKDAPARKELTQRQKDSVVAASRIPGAQGVGAAQRVADSAAARRARIDSAAQDH
jgi:hypothetical protein